MFGQENQALVEDTIYAVHSLVNVFRALHEINQGLRHYLFEERFHGNNWMVALNGLNEGAAGIAPQNAIGLGQGQGFEVAGDVNLAMGGGRGMPAGANPGQADRRLRSPDWKRLQLAPIRKNVYREHLKTSLRSPAEVDAYREANGIAVRGRGVPKPLLNIDEAGFPPDLAEAAQATGLSSLSGLHGQCWPVTLSGRDLLAIVHNETERRTLGYLLPAIVHVRHQEPFKPRDGPIVLVLTATRESAREIEQTVLDIEKYVSLRAVFLLSGVPKTPQLQNLKEGAQICVATPSRLVTFMEDKHVDLSRCSYLVVDGADRMLAMGLEKQLLTIAEHVRPDRQTLMWVTSRSLDIDHISDILLTDHVTVTFGASQTCQLHRVQHAVLVCEEDERENALITLFQDILCEGRDKVIVFVETRQTVDDLVVKMHDHNWPAVGVHRKKQEQERRWALEAFRLRSVPVLVATCVAACGLDADDVRFVVNYDRPARAEYTRRIKYAVRVDGSGKAYSFLAPSDSCHAEDMISILRDAKQDIPREVLNIAKGKVPSGGSRALDYYQ
ncbi:putative ATP-dependent RNA helicase DDX5 [Amblyomma americanum]|uniref:RNA helicase n=1 Tax=Amblyomma americanum TaxID=6943 RepID=A0AAQ4F365_AMBAM